MVDNSVGLGPKKQKFILNILFRFNLIIPIIVGLVCVLVVVDPPNGPFRRVERVYQRTDITIVFVSAVVGPIFLTS
jgi:hypothetical protein